MAYPKHVWGQLKNITVTDLERALDRDGWTIDSRDGSITIWIKEDRQSRRRVSVHFHPGKTFGPKLLKALLNDIGWSLEEMKKLKMIKR